MDAPQRLPHFSFQSLHPPLISVCQPDSSPDHPRAQAGNVRPVLTRAQKAAKAEMERKRSESANKSAKSAKAGDGARRSTIGNSLPKKRPPLV
eukprot:6212375-Pleurochrysis_carterae.AAC.1